MSCDHGDHGNHGNPCNHGNPQIPDSAEILSDGTLVMTSTDSSLTDVYQCTATNSYDNETASADVLVKGKSGVFITTDSNQIIWQLGMSLRVWLESTSLLDQIIP